MNKITPDMIESYIKEEHYVNLGQALGLESTHPTSVITTCVLLLKNGFTVTGESGCADPKNFNEDIGKAVARKHAVEKIWPLMGYALRNVLDGSNGLIENNVDFLGRMEAELSKLISDIEKGERFLRAETNPEGFKEIDVQMLQDQIVFMKEHSKILKQRINRENQKRRSFS